MALLVYCLMEASAGVAGARAGVGGAALEQLQESGLRCFFSRFHIRDDISHLPPIEAALEFNSVLQALFHDAVVIPFRFPAVVEDEQELLAYLREHASGYVDALARLRHMVQMEIRISAGAGLQNDAPPASGLEYLQHKRARTTELSAAVEKFRQATLPWVAEWREKRTNDAVRCYALLDRSAVASFQSAAGALSDSLPGTRVSGPWPPAEFVELRNVNG